MTDIRDILATGKPLAEVVADAIQSVEKACKRAEDEFPLLAAPDGTASPQFKDLRLVLDFVYSVIGVHPRAPEGADA